LLGLKPGHLFGLTLFQITDQQVPINGIIGMQGIQHRGVSLWNRSLSEAWRHHIIIAFDCKRQPGDSIGSEAAPV